MFWKKRVAVWLCVSVSCAVCGCFGNEVERYDLSGNVTIGGKPVPLGEVSFAPDVQRGNSGPGAVAQIKDGRFETAPDRGTVGGPHRITVTGFDGLAPRRYFTATAIDSAFETISATELNYENQDQPN